jgi:hypothetical protein
MKVAAMAVTPEDDADSSDCTSHHRGGSKGVESRNDSNGKNTDSKRKQPQDESSRNHQLTPTSFQSSLLECSLALEGHLIKYV